MSEEITEKEEVLENTEAEPKKKVAKKKAAKKQVAAKVEAKSFSREDYNWRENLPSEYLYPNKDFFARYNKPTPMSIDGLKDHELCIKLGGLRWLTEDVGVKSVDFNPCKLEDHYVVMKCTIVWSDGVSWSEMANATDSNCASFTSNFKETIASNRAFGRAVRSAFNINIVSDAELNQNENSGEDDMKTSNIASSPINLIKKLCVGEGIESFESFKDLLRTLWKDGSYKNEDAANWSKWDDISAKDARLLLSPIEKHFKNK